MAKMAASNSRKRPYGLLLLLALGMAILCAVALHQLREGRLLGLLLQEREQQLLNLQFILQEERESSKEMKRSMDDVKAKTFALGNQKMELTDKLTETRNTVAQLTKLRSELEAALVEKQIQVDKLTDKTEEFMIANLEVANLTSLLKQKEAEVEDMKRSLTKQAMLENSTENNEKSQRERFSISEERKEELAKFRAYKDEVAMKAENVSGRKQHEDEKKLTIAGENQTLGIKELNGAEGKDDTNTTEETFIQMKENDRIERFYHANREEISEQLKYPEGSKLAAKNESENAAAGITKSQYDLTEKTQVVQGMTNFSIDNQRTAYSESSYRNISSSKHEMERIEQARDNMGDGTGEATNNKSNENQREKDDENSKGLQHEVTQSSQANGNGFTGTIQKEAGKEAKSIGQSEIAEHTEESETKSKISDEKESESEGRSEKA